MRRSRALAAFALAAWLLPAPALAEGTLRTVLVIDASSSMRKTDPREVRKVAGEIFVDLARRGDQIAVTGFDEGVRESTGGFTEIRSPEDRAALKRAIRAVGNDGDWTNFGAGLGEARRMLEAAKDEPGDQEFIVFLTDGKCDPDPEGPLRKSALAARKPVEQFCQEALFRDFLPSVPGVRLYAVGLSRAAPRAFLEDLSRRTGGVGTATDRADELPALFAGIYARLLGAKLRHVPSAPSVELPLPEGLLSLDVVLVGPESLTLDLRGPSGKPVPKEDAARVLHTESPAYRHFKVLGPEAGVWKAEVGGGGTGGRLVALESPDLELAFLDLPDVVEQGGSVRVRLALRTRANRTAPLEFLDRHAWSVQMANAGKDCAAALAAKPVEVPVARSADGVFEATVPAPVRGELCFVGEVRPGKEGVLSRRVTSAPVRVVPPMRLAAEPLRFSPVRQDDEGKATLDLGASKIGDPVKVRLELVEGDEGVDLEPDALSIGPGKTGPFELRARVDRDALPGARPRKLRVLPVDPKGYEGRAIEVPVELAVVPLTFWERYGFLISTGAGSLVFLFLLAGFALPARFPKRMILHYRDARDPDLPRTATYPLGVKAKAGFFRPAKAHLAATGPLRKPGPGALVELVATGSGASARPLSGKARELPREDADGFATGSAREVRLKDGRFRVAPGARYEIEGSGLSFWCTLR